MGTFEGLTLHHEKNPQDILPPSQGLLVTLDVGLVDYMSTRRMGEGSGHFLQITTLWTVSAWGKKQELDLRYLESEDEGYRSLSGGRGRLGVCIGS